MKLVLYPKLGTPSKRAFRRLRTRQGWFYQYQPRVDLVARLQFETGLSKEEIYERFEEERDQILRTLYGEDYLSNVRR